MTKALFSNSTGTYKYVMPVSGSVVAFSMLAKLSSASFYKKTIYLNYCNLYTFCQWSRRAKPHKHTGVIQFAFIWQDYYSYINYRPTPTGPGADHWIPGKGGGL